MLHNIYILFYYILFLLYNIYFTSAHPLGVGHLIILSVRNGVENMENENYYDLLTEEEKEELKKFDEWCDTVDYIDSLGNIPLIEEYIND